MASTECLELNNGLKMPVMGFGTWKAKAEGEAAAAVFEAIKAGYRHLDCAYVYGNEKEVGEGIKKALEELGIKREDLFITSKLWNTRHNPQDVEPSVKESLALLGLEYLDLYLIHWPHAYRRGGSNFPLQENGIPFFDEDVTILQCWGAMEKLVEQGLVKSIGVSNFNTNQLREVLDNGKIKPVTNQVERHPYLNQAKLNAFCKAEGITITAYSPLGSGDRPWATKDDPVLLDDQRIKAIGDKHGKTSAQIILKWQIQGGNVSVIPKSVNPGRIAQNAAIFDFTLTDEEMKEMESFHVPEGAGRLIQPLLKGKPRDIGHPLYPFKDGIDQ